MEKIQLRAESPIDTEECQETTVLGGGQLLSEEARGLEGRWDSLPKSRNSGALSAKAGHK